MSSAAERIEADVAAAGGNGHAPTGPAKTASNQAPSAAEQHMFALLQAGMTSAELLSRPFAPMQWIALDLIPAEGMTVVGAKMGLGKSYLLLQLGGAVSTGTQFLGRATKRQGVLLIALEDSERRINSRLNQLGIIGTDKLLIYTRWGKGKQALEDLRLLLACRPDIRLVIIDPIVKFIDLLDFNDYGGSYGALGPIKDALDARGVAGIFSHHCKKSIAELDAFDDLLGSTGWGASCDTRLVLRRQRGSAEGTLIAGGRDVLHSESALRFDGDSGWQYQGAAEDVRMSDERREILELLNEAGPLSAAEISKRLGKNYSTTRNLMVKLQEAGKVGRDPENPRRYRSGIVSVVDSEPKEPKSATVATPATPTITTTHTIEEQGDAALFPEGET